jgi:hypothetical protein
MIKPRIKRLPDWSKRFHDYIDEIKATPFNWETHNCAHICAGAVVAMTGKDLSVGYKRAKSTRHFIEAMKKHKFNNLTELVASKLNKIHISKAKIGDIAAFKSDDAFGISLGIVNGDHVLVFDEKGMGIRPLFDADFAFEV